MNFLNKSLLFSLVMASVLGCVSDQEDSRVFEELDTAEDLTCHKWFLDERSLGIYDIFPVGDNPHGLVAKIRRRDNAIQFHHRFFKGRQLDEEGTSQLFIDPHAMILGSYVKGGQGARQAMMALINPANGFRLELRSMPQNKVVYQDPKERQEIFDTQYMTSQSKIWLAYRQDDENATSRLMVYHPKGDKAFTTKVITKLDFNLTHDLLVAHNGGVFVIRRKSSGGRVRISYSYVSPQGKVSAPVDLNVPIKSRVDSWTAIAKGGHIYVAAIDGEAFLRQASLRVAKMKVDGKVLKVSWVKTRSLMDFHVSTPVFQNSSNGLAILIPKWLDEKSTLARYNVENEGISGVGHVGEFLKASTITSSYYNDSQKKSFFVVRTKGGDVGWQFQVCEME